MDPILVEAWRCSGCSLVRPTLEEAEACCRCPYCKQAKPGRRYECDACQEKRYAERQARLIAKAQVVTYEAYAHEALYDETHDAYYLSLEELDDADPDPWPEWLWACRSVTLRLDVERMLDAALEEHHDEAGDRISDAELTALQAQVDDWCARQDVTSWVPDYSIRVLIPPKDPEDD